MHDLASQNVAHEQKPMYKIIEYESMKMTYKILWSIIIIIFSTCWTIQIFTKIPNFVNGVRGLAQDIKFFDGYSL